jgi:HSP20 family protein
MNITRYEPRYRPLGLLGRLLQDEDFDTLLRSAGEPDSVSDWLPAVDVREEDSRFVIHADLPGVDPEDIEVSMEDGVLTIKGERHAESEEDQHGYRRFERVSGSFLRRFSLPDTADDSEISASTRHGVLEITIPKQAKRLARKIDVQAG